MTIFVLAAAIAAQAAPAATPPVTATPPASGRTLRDVPGLTLTHRDLTEKDVKGITKALKSNKPISPQQQQLLAATTSWNVAPTFTKRTTGTECVITKVNVVFTATATLPRFNSAWIKAEDLPAWQSFLSNIESGAAAQLFYPYDRLAGFDQSMVGKPCDQAIKDGGAFMDKVKADAAAFRPPAPAAAAPAATPAAQ